MRRLLRTGVFAGDSPAAGVLAPLFSAFLSADFAGDFSSVFAGDFAGVFAGDWAAGAGAGAGAAHFVLRGLVRSAAALLEQTARFLVAGNLMANVDGTLVD